MKKTLLSAKFEGLQTMKLFLKILEVKAFIQKDSLKIILCMEMFQPRLGTV